MSAVKRYAPEIGPSFSSLDPGAALVNVIDRKTKVVSLTAAQIIAMGTVPVNIIASPGTGRAIIVESIFVKITRTATAFTGGGVVHFYYTALTAEIMAQTIAAAQITGGAGEELVALAPVQTATGSVVTKEVGVEITNATAAFAAGTGTLKLFIVYRIVTL
jgi:hypothetical protein